MEKSRKKPIQVLLIDDDIEFADSLVNRAKRYQVLLSVKNNLKDGVEEFLANSKYQALILPLPIMTPLEYTHLAETLPPLDITYCANSINQRAKKWE